MTTTKPKTDVVEHPSLTAALAAFQAEVPTIRKGNEARVASQKGSYTYAYADLSDVTEKVLPLLGKHGLSFSAVPTQTKRLGFVLKYSLRHTSGGVVKGTYPLPPASTPAQQLGSAITYARRYALTAVTGVAPGGDDDDAHTAPVAEARKQAPRRAPQKQEPARDWLGLANAEGTRAGVERVWHAAKTAGAEVPLLDKIATIGRERAATEEAQAAEEGQASEASPTEESAEELAVA